MITDSHVYSWREKRWLNLAAGDNEKTWTDDPDQIELVRKAIAKMVIPYWLTESEPAMVWRCGCGRIVFNGDRECSSCARGISLNRPETLSEAEYEAAMARVRDSMTKTSNSLTVTENGKRVSSRKPGRGLVERKIKADRERKRFLAEERTKRSEQNLKKTFFLREQQRQQQA